MNSQSAAQAPAARLLDRRRVRPQSTFAVSPEAQQIGREYAAMMDRGEFDHAQLARDIADAD